MNALAGTGLLARLHLRRDRIMLPLWLYAVAGLTIVTAVSFRQLYPTVPSRLSFAATVSANPALLALTGPTYDLTSIGGLTAWRVGGLGGVLIGLMNVFLVVRHTRAEEESGRLELVGACAVGRRAPLTAGLAVALGADLLIGVVITVVLPLLGMPVAGSAALGLSLAAAGACFAGVSAVAAQLTEGSRAANGIGCAVLGAAFLLRAVGDSTPSASWLGWASPIGWGQRLRPFAGERWWVFALPGAWTVALVAVAFLLVARRDLGGGLFAARPGPGEGRLRGPFGVAWRLQRGPLLGWAVGFAVFGGVIGAITPDVATLASTSGQLTRVLASLGGTRGVTDAFLAGMFGLLGLIASGYAVSAVLRLRTEETALRAEPVLATRVGRVRFAASHVVFAALGGAAVLAVAGLFAGLADGLRGGDLGPTLGRVLVGALAQVPATWALAAVAVALFGLVPRASTAAWAALVVCLLLSEFGPSLHAPQWAMDVSPFTHVPKLPGGTVTAEPILWLVVAAAALTAAGLAGFRRRDIG